jgi:hypothetical protein
MPATSEVFNFAYCAPLTVLRKTLYPVTTEVLAFQVSATECCTAAVKFTPVTFAALTVTFWLAGVKT